MKNLKSKLLFVQVLIDKNHTTTKKVGNNWEKIAVKCN